jgi:acyl-CoA reductase-like NAD-dependent aldehyde dehydrogenase
MWTLPIAITLGNTLILKPSEKVPLTMNRTMDLLREAGLPPGVVNIVHGGAETSKLIVEHPEINAVSFVGSSPVAEWVSLKGRSLGKRVLALGGAKNHLVAYPDCNPDMAAQDIVNSFTGCTGQRCMAASVLLTIGKQPQLTDLIVEKAKALLPGQENGQVGPVIDGASLQRILRYIQESADAGAEILLDGRNWVQIVGSKSGGSWVGPTVILHKDRKDKALHDEIFGPVLSIFEVASKEEAIEIENANPYGNAGMSMWKLTNPRFPLCPYSRGLKITVSFFSFHYYCKLPSTPPTAVSLNGSQNVSALV